MKKINLEQGLRGLLLVAATMIISMLSAHAEGQLASLPDPAQDETLARISSQQSAVFAGGCFWGVQAVFQHTKGVISATSGYAGGTASAANYEQVSSGKTGHAESVKVIYDPAQISYGKLLKIYFAVAHNPTELNRQGPDSGTQYRSEIFALSAAQQKIAEGYIQQLDAAKVYPQKIVTRVSALPTFYAAEDYHQDFATRHPHHPYIVRFDLPKLEQLRAQFPKMYQPYPLKK